MTSTALPRLCGLDEVGRGALAGPIMAAAVVLPDDLSAFGADRALLRDSKTLSARQRVTIAARIQEIAIVVALEEITSSEIDHRGITWANGALFYRLIERVDADQYVVDGSVRPPTPPDRAERVTTLVKADASVPAVAAASIVAKVARDAAMALLSVAHPAYGWDKNAGYGAPHHLAALRSEGATSHHRRTFIRKIVGE